MAFARLANLLDARGGDMPGMVGPRRVRASSLFSVTEVVFQLPGGALVEVEAVLCTARRWRRMGCEADRPDAWCVIPVGPLVMAVRLDAIGGGR